MKPEERFFRELKIDTYLRNHVVVFYFITLIIAAALYGGIYLSLQLFENGHYWSLITSGLFAHAFFVITMHDTAHQSLTQRSLDRWIMNTAAGMIILPLYTELFRKYHLLHHAHTNTNLDPLWGSNKKYLFENHRFLYAVLQSLPFVLNFYMLISRTKKEKQAHPFQPRINGWYIAWSFIVALFVIYYVQPPFWFVFGTFGVMTSIGAIRYWGEHMGVDQGKESNTHWFPLGMGIGNHEAHHYYPELSWLSLTIGMWYRSKDTHPIKTVYRLFFDDRFHHYESKRQIQDKEDKSMAN
jgi:fatty acid desaturase